MKILVTGFKGKHNSSCQLLQDMNGDKLFLTNSFAGLERDIRNCECEKYDAAIMFGLDTRLKESVRIEPYANGTEGRRESVLDLYALSKELDHHCVKNDRSDRASNYLCNHAYYHMLNKMHGKAVLIHIPPERYLTDEWKQRMGLVIDAYRRDMDM